MCNVKFFFNFFWCVCIFVSFRNRGRKKSRYLRGKPIREQPRQTLFSKRRNLVEITRFIFAKKQWGKRKKKLRMVLIWRVKSALILSLLFYLIDYLKCHFPFPLCLIVKYIVVFFLSLIMNFFCPPRLALATREPGENCQSSSENLQMLIQVFIPVEPSSFSVFSVFDSISSRFSLLYSAREEEILDCGSSSSLLAR